MTIELTDEAIEQIGEELHRMMGVEPMDEHVEGAKEILDDEDMIAYAVVAIRKGDDGCESASQRVVDPEVVRNANCSQREFVNLVHESLCSVFDQEVRDR